MNPTLTQAHRERADGLTLITGGAGFIGTNLADRLLAQGHRVVIFDNLSRNGVERNLRWLRARYPKTLRIEIGDVRDAAELADATRGVTSVFHFAAQVAVTTSLSDPMQDFEVNGRGTLNLLEALRRRDQPVSLLFTSTNKVYGQLADVGLDQQSQRYIRPEGEPPGFSEDRPLSFHSPYGCSKGSADQYVLDYAHTFGLCATVFRMSCIYGPHQCGNEDQGWVAHFLLQALRGEAITLYGDGRQVRDILFVDDLIDAMLLTRKFSAAVAGQAFNIGGGAEHTISLLELAELIAELRGERPVIQYAPWRAADQRYYVSDTKRFFNTTGWHPRTSVREGVDRLHAWLVKNVVRDDARTPAAVDAEERETSWAEQAIDDEHFRRVSDGALARR